MIVKEVEDGYLKPRNRSHNICLLTKADKSSNKCSFAHGSMMAFAFFALMPALLAALVLALTLAVAATPYFLVALLPLTSKWTCDTKGSSLDGNSNWLGYHCDTLDFLATPLATSSSSPFLIFVLLLRNLSSLSLSTLVNFGKTLNILLLQEFLLLVDVM
jgi:hypothetical protein